MKIEIQKYRLNFTFEARTSRGVMTSKESWFIKLYDAENPEIFGIGECGPLQGLSPDLNGKLAEIMRDLLHEVTATDHLELADLEKIIPVNYPALRFAMETAILDLRNGGKRILYENEFTKSLRSIPINGLVWMGDKQAMIQRIMDKINEGYTCIKIKIGAIDFEDELALLKFIRSQFSSDQVTIRLDANGAFKITDAPGILNRLSAFDIHSIEQPITAGNWLAMEKLCNLSPIPIALDEELIGLHDQKYKIELLEKIRPSYIILKPTLIGGLHKSEEWIELATKLNIGWWITSALESNIGLNAIAQFTANYPTDIPQGLGTGQLYHNNIPSPLSIKRGALIHDNFANWDLSNLG